MIAFKHEVFFEVARQLSFTKASEVLCISQPAISNHIKQLEEEFKTNLFERKGNPFHFKQLDILFDQGIFRLC